MALSRTVKLIEDKLGLDDADSSTLMVRVNNLCALMGDGGRTQLMPRIQWLAQEVGVSSTAAAAPAAPTAPAAVSLFRLPPDLFETSAGNSTGDGGAKEKEDDDDDDDENGEGHEEADEGESGDEDGEAHEVNGAAADQGRLPLPMPSLPPMERPLPSAAPPLVAAPKAPLPPRPRPPSRTLSLPPPPSSPASSAFLFIADARTQDEMFRQEVFALPKHSFTDMLRILPSTTLLLYNRSSRLFYGPFTAVGQPGLDMVPGAFGGRFQAQLRFKLATPSMRTISEANLQIWRKKGDSVSGASGGAKNSKAPSSAGFLSQADAALLRSWFLQGDPLAGGGGGVGGGGAGDDGRGTWRGAEVHLKLVAWGIPNPAGVASLLHDEEMDFECLSFSTVNDLMEVGLEEHIAKLLFGAIQGAAKAIRVPLEQQQQVEMKEEEEEEEEEEASRRPAALPPPPQESPAEALSENARPAATAKKKTTKLCRKKNGTRRFGNECNFAHRNGEMRNDRPSGAAAAAAPAAAMPLSQEPVYHIPSSLAPTITDSVVGTNSDFTGTRTLLNLSRTATNLDTVIYASSKQRKAHRKITGFEVERARRYGTWTEGVASEKDVVAGFAAEVGEALMVCLYRDTVVTFSPDRSTALESHRKGTKLSRTQTIFKDYRAKSSSSSSSGSSSSKSSSNSNSSNSNGSVEKGAKNTKEESSEGAAAVAVVAKKEKEPPQDSPAPQQPQPPAPKASGKKRTQLCASWRKTKSCAAGDKCLFAHGKSEIGTYQSAIRGQQPLPQQSLPQQSQPKLQGGGGGYFTSRSFPPRWWKPPRWSSTAAYVEPSNHCSSHTVLVVDASGSIRKSLGGIMGLLSSEFASPQVKQGSHHDAVSLILMKDGGAELVFYRRPLTEELVADLKLSINFLKASGDGNYIPALDFVEEATQDDCDMDYATIVMFLSDGAPSDVIGNEDAFVERLGIDKGAVARHKGLKKRMFLMSQLTSKRMRKLRASCGPARFRLVVIAVGQAFDTMVMLAMADSVRGTFRASFGGEHRLRSAFNVVSETLTATKTSISESQLQSGGSRTQRRDVNIVKQSSASQTALEAFAEEDEDEETDSEEEGMEYQFDEQDAAGKSDPASPASKEACEDSPRGAEEQSVIEQIEADPDHLYIHYSSFESWQYFTREKNETEVAEDDFKEPDQKAQGEDLLHPFSKGSTVTAKKRPGCSYSLTGRANIKRGGETMVELQQLSGKGMQANDKSPRIHWLDKASLKPYVSILSFNDQKVEKGKKQKSSKKKKEIKVDDKDEEKKSTSRQVLEGIFNTVADKAAWVRNEVARRRAAEAEKRAAEFLETYEKEDRGKDRKKSKKSKGKSEVGDLPVKKEKKAGWLTSGVKSGEVSVTKDAFHFGAERVVFHVKKRWKVNNKNMKSKILVGKEPRTEEDHCKFGSEMMAYHKTFAETSQMAVNLASAFMRSVANHHLKVCNMKFLEPEIIKVRDDRSVYGGERWLYCETNLDKIANGESKYVKWNSNAGQIFKNKECNSSKVCGGKSRLAKMKYSEVLQCFSHWTFEHTNEALLVCDLQGIYVEPKPKEKDGEQEAKEEKKEKPQKNEKKEKKKKKPDSDLPTFILTDPVIHKSQREDDEDRQGRTDLGETGIIHFFETHQCNELCRALKLQDRADWVGARTCTILTKKRSARYAREEENRTAEQCRIAGYSLREMKQGGYTLHQMHTIPDVSMAELKDAGFDDLQEHRAAGATAISAKGGFADRTIVEAGYTPSECRAAGVKEGIILAVHGEKSTIAGGRFCLGEKVYVNGKTEEGVLAHSEACVIGRGKIFTEISRDYFADDYIQVHMLGPVLRGEYNVDIASVETEIVGRIRHTKIMAEEAVAAKAAVINRGLQLKLSQLIDKRRLDDASRTHMTGDKVKIYVLNSEGESIWQRGRVIEKNLRRPDSKEEEFSIPYVVELFPSQKVSGTWYVNSEDSIINDAGAKAAKGRREQLRGYR